MADYLHVLLVPEYIHIAVSSAVAVGLLVFAPARWSYRALAGFFVCSATASAFSIVALVEPSYAVYVAATQAQFAAAALSVTALAAFAVAYPRPTKGSLVGFGLSATYLLGLVIWQLVSPHDPFWRYGPVEQGLGLFTPGAGGSITGVRPGALAMLPASIVGPWIIILLAWRRAAATGRLRRSLLALVVAFSVGPVFATVDALLLFVPRLDMLGPAYGDGAILFFVIRPLVLLVLYLMAVLMTIRQDRPRSCGGRWTLLAMAAALGAMTGTFLPSDSPTLLFINSLVGLLLPLWVGFAVLRGDFPDLDVKARMGVRSGTLTAMFLVAGFVVSEAAVKFFGDRTGSEYWGIAAAGLLVLAISPLQRLADRVAKAAVPHATPIVAMDPSEKAIAFEEVLRMAWADGAVSAAERARIEAARERFGISIEMAHALEQRMVSEP